LQGDPAVPFKPVRARRTFEEVAGQVRSLLSAGHLQPGDRLPPERLLSQQLGVSRSALREALRGLEMSGVIELKKGKTGGAFITNGNPLVVSGGMTDLLQLGNLSFSDLTEARLWIEAVVVRVACERATEDDVSALEENLRTAEALYKQGKLVEKTLANIEFHDLLARATRNPVLVMMARTMNDVMRAFAERLGSDPSRTVLGSRRKFMAALKARDADAAIAENEKTLKGVHKFYARATRRVSN
jgi:GntR family transcriptional regulator, transcriptional repressor for pyruvate dehydrogenase complex